MTVGAASSRMIKSLIARADVRWQTKQKAEGRPVSVATKRQFEQPDFRRQSAGAEVRRQQ